MFCGGLNTPLFGKDRIVASSESGSKHHALLAATGRIAVTGMSAQMALRINFAIKHLLSAARFSREVGRIETANAGKPFGDWWEEMSDYAVACILLTSAVLESYANELFSDRGTVFPDAAPKYIDKIWTITERRPPLEKLDLVLELREQPALDKKTKLYKAISAVILLRNELTHFKPEWTNEPRKHHVISDTLKGYFTPSAITNDPLIFPRAWITHSCTSWAVNATLEFIEEFERLAALVGRTDRTKFIGRIEP
jgi:hypothetical protein